MKFVADAPLPRMLLWTSLVLFATSLAFDGYCVAKADGAPTGHPAYMLLLLGWLGVLDGFAAWLANPAMLAAWILLTSPRERRAAMVAAGAAGAFALSFLLHRDILVNEAGHRSAIVRCGLGYRLWLASAAAAFAAAGSGAARRRPSAAVGGGVGRPKVLETQTEQMAGEGAAVELALGDRAAPGGRERLRAAADALGGGALDRLADTHSVKSRRHRDGCRSYAA